MSSPFLVAQPNSCCQATSCKLMKSGPNQHYIPRFVQRAFGIPPSRRQIWYFERGRPPEQRAIKRTASQDHFYSRPARSGDLTLDDRITSVENPLSLALRAIRSLPVGNSVDSHNAAAIIAHLAPRTAHIRDTLKQGVAKILDHATALFTDPANLQAIVGLDQPLPNDQFRERVLADLIERHQLVELNLPTQVLERVAFYLAKENVSDWLETGLPLLRPILDNLLSGSDRLVRDSHNKALAQSLVSSPREIFLKSLNWTIENAPTAGAILPDCVVIAINKDGHTAPYMLAAHDDLRALVMPVSPEKLLVGIAGGYAIPRTFDYNTEAARLSYGFFLSSQNDAETARLHPAIAERPTAILDEGVERGFRNFRLHRCPQRPETAANRPDVSPSLIDATSREFGYELSFVGYGDQEGIEQVTGHLRTIVSALSQALPLTRLDGITVTGDYPATLRSLDRGFENARPVETVSREVGVGVAQMITVLRSNEVKGRIVMSSAIAHSLTSNNAGDVEFGVYVVVRKLALVAMIEFLEDALPGVMLSPIEREFDRWLYPHVDPGLHAYVASCIAAEFGRRQERVEAKRQFLAAAINRMREAVLKERLAYRYHGDLDKLLAVTLPSVRQALKFAGDLLGHSAIVGCSPFQDSDELHISLEHAGLKNWLEMYRVDLEGFYKRLGRWRSFDEFLSFNVHVERLLWQLGMLPWEGPEGIRVEVPLGTDATTLLARATNDKEQSC